MARSACRRPTPIDPFGPDDQVTTDRLPGLEPDFTACSITCAADAIEAIDEMRTHPAELQIVVIALDDFSYFAHVVINELPGVGAESSVVNFLAEAFRTAGLAPEFVVASVRPDLPVDPDDAWRWLDLSDAVEASGGELIEWFVVDGRGNFWCPRDLTDEPPRW